MILHIDGDVLVYRAGFAAEHTFWSVSWPEGDEYHTREFQSRALLNEFMEQQQLDKLSCAISSRREAEPIDAALLSIRSMIKSMVQKTGALRHIVYLSGPDNFREGIATIKPYKGNRDKAVKPIHAAGIKQMIRRTYETVTSDGQEADDDMAMAHYKLWLEDPDCTCIATIDKDLNMVPGMHYNFVRDEQYYVTPEEGLRWFQMQLLMGDTTDNIPGVDGLGPKKAERALDVPEADRWKAIAYWYWHCYAENWLDALRENGQLLWMRLKADELWQPPEELTDYNPEEYEK